MFFIIAFCVGVGLWFIYDGAIAWPKQNAIFQEHEKFEKEGRKAEWPDFARSKGWDPQPPEKLHDAGDLKGQFVRATGILAGLAVGTWLAMCWKRTLRSDADSVYGDTGKRVAFDEMKSVDRRKMDTKGIAVVIYERDGRKRKLVLDDYKYAGGEQILQEVEARLSAKAAGPSES